MICRLCSKNSEKIYNFFDSEGLKMEIVSIVAKHFWFEPKSEDNTSHLICSSCWIITKNFHELYLLVERVEKEWTNNLSAIKEDPCNHLVDFDKMCFENYEKENDCKSDDIDENVREDNSDLKDNAYNFYDNVIKVEINEEKNNSVTEDIPLKEEKLKRTNRKRGRPPNTKNKNKNKISKKMDHDEYNTSDDENIDNDKEIKQEKQKSKRSAEETAAFNRKVAEGDALIAKFMKIFCNVCMEEQKNFTSLKHHCTSVHGIQGVVICCERKFYRKSKLVEHIEIHFDPEKHKCHVCDHVSANRWNLKLHMESLHKKQIKPFKCSYCGKDFKLQAQLIRHELIHLPEEQKKFKCSYCDKNFPSEASLKYHIRLCHEGYYSGVCDICGRAYNNRSDLKRHRLQVHEGVEKSTYKCKYCDKEFASKYTYNLHKFREHENQNPNVDYRCPICNKTSANSEALKNHIQYVHKAKAKFECTLCDKVFKRELALKEHMAAHIGQSLYSCPHCPKTFTHSSNMHHHRKLKHPLEFELARKVKEDKKETWREFTSLNV